VWCCEWFVRVGTAVLVCMCVRREFVCVCASVCVVLCVCVVRVLCVNPCVLCCGESVRVVCGMSSAVMFVLLSFDEFSAIWFVCAYSGWEIV